MEFHFRIESPGGRAITVDSAESFAKSSPGVRIEVAVNRNNCTGIEDRDIVDSQHRVIANYGFVLDVGRDTAYANADLIAAAPDMYEILDELLDGGIWPDMNARVRKVLKKAKGENDG